MKIPRRASSHGAGLAEAGYNLVVLMVAITVMNILIAAALPLWSRIIQHDKEEELIFRGLQYAEAIRVFRNRFQRAPVRIEELMEAKPRCIRQLWKDPMTEDGKWKVLYEGIQQPPGTLTPQPPGQEKGGGGGKGGGKGEGSDGSGDDVDSGPNAEEGSDGSEGDSGFLTTEKKEQLTIGPIEGVVSKSPKRSAMIWFGQERYDQWQFRWGIVAQPKSFGVPGAEGQPVPQGESVRWLGRPWPKWLGIQSAPALPQPGGLNPPPGGAGGGAFPRQNPPAGGEEGGGAFGVPGGLPEEPPEEPKE